MEVCQLGTHRLSLFGPCERAAVSSVSLSSSWILTLCSDREERMQKEKESKHPRQQKISEVMSTWPQSESEGSALAGVNRAGMLMECTDTLPVDRRATWYLIPATPQHS